MLSGNANVLIHLNTTHTCTLAANNGSEIFIYILWEWNNVFYNLWLFHINEKINVLDEHIRALSDRTEAKEWTYKNVSFRIISHLNIIWIYHEDITCYLKEFSFFYFLNFNLCNDLLYSCLWCCLSYTGLQGLLLCLIAGDNPDHSLRQTDDL